jgi:hypothetical protein
MGARLGLTEEAAAEIERVGDVSPFNRLIRRCGPCLLASLDLA